MAFTCSFNFKRSYSTNKASFYKAFNAIFGKVGRSASEEVLFALLKSKCLPILLHGTEACPTNSSVRQSLKLTFNRVLCKIFGAMSSDSFVMYGLYFFRFKTRRRINLCATESLCYQIYLAREQFMWPNIEEILLTMFCTCDSCLSVNSVLLCVSVLEHEFVVYF